MKSFSGLFFLAIISASCGGQDPLGADANGTGQDSLGYADTEWQPANVEIGPMERPYANRSKERWEILASPCAEAVRVVFSRIEVEAGHDAVLVRDPSGQIVQRLTGLHRNLHSVAIAGNSLVLELKSDSTVKGFGFDIERVEAVYSPGCVVDESASN